MPRGAAMSAPVAQNDARTTQSMRSVVIIAALAGCGNAGMDLLREPGAATRAADAIAKAIGRPRGTIDVLKVSVKPNELAIYVPDADDPTRAARWWFDGLGGVAGPKTVEVDGDVTISKFSLGAMPFDRLPSEVAMIGMWRGARVSSMRLQLNAIDSNIPLLQSFSFDDDHKPVVELYPDGRVWP
jgi:hypothetical protein